MVDTAIWEFVDTVYSEGEVKHIVENLQRSGKLVLAEPHKTPNEMPCWQIYVARDNVVIGKKK